MIGFCLLSKEALSSMILHCTSISTSLLNKTNHCLIAYRIKAWIISCSKPLRKMIISFSNSINTEITFDIVSIISNESCSVIKHYSHGLIVDRWPGTILCLSTFGGNNFVTILEIKVVCFGLSKLKMMIWVLDLDFVWKFVSAKFFSLEKIYFFNLCRYWELPFT